MCVASFKVFILRVWKTRTELCTCLSGCGCLRSALIQNDTLRDARKISIVCTHTDTQTQTHTKQPFWLEANSWFTETFPCLRFTLTIDMTEVNLKHETDLCWKSTLNALLHTGYPDIWIFKLKPTGVELFRNSKNYIPVAVCVSSVLCNVWTAYAAGMICTLSFHLKQT